MKRSVLVILGVALIAGCSREDQQAIRVQQVPKQPAPEPVMAMQMPAEGTAASEIQWTLPAGWKQLPAQQMRYASFQISPEHPDIVVTIVPLGVEGGQILPNVNRWEQQVGLPPTAEANLPNVVKTMDVDGNRVSTVDLIGPATADPQLGMFGAILPRPDRVWFFKLAGPAKVIAPYKGSFEEFVKSIHFGPGGDAKPQAAAPDGPVQLPAGHPAIPGAAPDNNPPLPAGHPQIPGAPGNMQMPMDLPSGQITYTVPPGWKKEDAKPMRFVSFVIPSGDRQSEVIVSELPSTAGSRQDNINRWRAQVGLAPLTPDEPQPSTTVKVGGVEGALFDLIGPGDNTRAQHMLVAWVPKGNDWWFFKITGPDDLVTMQRANFESFLKSVQFVPEKP